MTGAHGLGNASRVAPARFSAMATQRGQAGTGYPQVMEDKTAILARLPLFAKLDPRSLEAVATLAKVATKPAGTVLMEEGEPARAFYVIVTGTIHIERDGDFIRSMTDGGFLGEIGLIEGTKHTATATCATDCELVELGAYEFGRVMATFPDVRARVEAAAARRPHEDLV